MKKKTHLKTDETDYQKRIKSIFALASNTQKPQYAAVFVCLMNEIKFSLSMSNYRNVSRYQLNCTKEVNNNYKSHKL